MRDLRVFRCVEAYPGIAAGRACRARSNGRPSGDRASGERQPDERVRTGISGWARAGCGRHCAVRPMKLTACTIISKPQNTGLLVNQKASYRRKQTRRASRWAAGAERRDGLATQQVVARRRRSSVGLRCRCGTRSAIGAGGAPWSRPVRMPGCGARSGAGASGTLEHERRDEAVGVRRRRGARLSGLAARAKPQDAPVFYSAPVFGAPILPFVMLSLAFPSSGPFCRKTAPNLTSPLNFWAVFEGLFCAELL